MGAYQRRKSSGTNNDSIFFGKEVEENDLCSTWRESADSPKEHKKKRFAQKYSYQIFGKNCEKDIENFIADVERIPNIEIQKLQNHQEFVRHVAREKQAHSALANYADSQPMMDTSPGESSLANEPSIAQTNEVHNFWNLHAVPTQHFNTFEKYIETKSKD